MQKVNSIPYEKINSVLQECLKVNDKYYIMSLLGITCGFRISDLISLKVSDVSDKNICIVEKKTGKIKTTPIQPSIKKIINQYIKIHDLNKIDYLIYSSQKNKDKHISRTQAYYVMNEIGKRLNLKSIGTHSLRKTYAKLLYQQSEDIKIVMQGLNHDFITTSLLYLIDDFSNLKI